MNPYAPPKAVNLDAPAGNTVVWQDGRWVVWQSNQPFPPCCLACGAPVARLRRTRLIRRPAWWRLFMLLFFLAWLFVAPGLLITLLEIVGVGIWLFGFIAVLVADRLLRQVVELRAGWCEHHGKWRLAARIFAIITPVALLGMIGVKPEVTALGLLVYVLLALALALSPWRWLVTTVQVGRQNGDRIWLSGSGAALRQQLPPYVGDY